MPACFASLLFFLATVAFAGSAQAATIEARDAWIRATPPGAVTAAGYVTLINRGCVGDRLTGGHTVAAAGVEVHQMSMARGVMRMRALPAGLAIAAGATAELAPNGAHLMLVGVKHPLKSGDHVRAVLDFAHAGPITVDFRVRDAPPAVGMGKM